MKPIQVGLLGLGTVGGGTVNVLARNAAEIARRAGRHIVITQAAAREIKHPHINGLEAIAVTTDAHAVVDNPDTAIIVELIGGYEPARELVLRAIRQGKHVVTANKALIAKHGNEIFKAAHAAGVIVAFEAAVGGGIPIIKAIREGLAANRIEWLAGIINGTGSYILTEMRTRGRAFAEALAEAQALGYAEADPTFDIEGIDAAHKLTILASLAFGISLRLDKVYTEGISQLLPVDIAHAEELGYRIKHLGIARRTAQGIELRVHPTLIPERRLIANVDGVKNAILVMGDAVGPTLYYGAGAGAEPTASAVVADLIDVTRTLTADPRHRVPYLAFQLDELTEASILPMDAVETAYYLRMLARDKPGVLADITHILGEHGISIEAVLQKEPEPGATDVSIIMLTYRVREQRMNDAIQRIEALDSVSGTITRLRLETLQ